MSGFLSLFSVAMSGLYNDNDIHKLLVLLDPSSFSDDDGGETERKREKKRERERPRDRESSACD